MKTENIGARENREKTRAESSILNELSDPLIYLFTRD